MNAHATSFLTDEFDTSLAKVLAALGGHEDKPLIIEYGEKQVQPGYHVTEVKAGSFVTMDCGGNPDAWQETILQVEDIPADDGQTFMSAGKFVGILAQVNRKVRLNDDARLTVEIGVPGAPMQVFDVAAIDASGDNVVMRLGTRAAICKPRHRAAKGEACCSPSASGKSACCS